MLLDLKALTDYSNWVGQTAWDVYHSVLRVGGWQRVFPGPLPCWASRIRQYFNLTPMTFKLLDHDESNAHLARAQTALPASARAKAYRSKLQSRGMGISFYAPGSSTKPGTLLIKPDPSAPIDTIGGMVGTTLALSGDVYEDELGRTIWFQMAPGGGIYHYGPKPRYPTVKAAEATMKMQPLAPVFKLVCPDGTGGSRECCITNPQNHTGQLLPNSGTINFGDWTIGKVNEVVNVQNRIVTDSVAQGSYNYAETTVKGLPAHERLDVKTDPMKPGFFVEPPDLFKFSDLWARRFPPNDSQGKPLAAQSEPAPGRSW
jgi:hypothetical protein